MTRSNDGAKPTGPTSKRHAEAGGADVATTRPPGVPVGFLSVTPGSLKCRFVWVYVWNRIEIRAISLVSGVRVARPLWEVCAYALSSACGWSGGGRRPRWPVRLRAAPTPTAPLTHTTRPPQRRRQPRSRPLRRQRPLLRRRTYWPPTARHGRHSSKLWRTPTRKIPSCRRRWLTRNFRGEGEPARRLTPGIPKQDGNPP